MFNETRLIRYDSYVIDEQQYCTNDKWCQNLNTNQTFECPLWTAYCKRYYELDAAQNNTKAMTPEDEKLEDFVDDPELEKYAYLCHYFEEANSVRLKAGIPGISSAEVIKENFHPHHLDKGETYPGVKGLEGTEIINSDYTSWLILFGIFFPSVTGNLFECGSCVENERYLYLCLHFDSDRYYGRHKSIR